MEESGLRSARCPACLQEQTEWLLSVVMLEFVGHVGPGLGAGCESQGRSSHRSCWRLVSRRWASFSVFMENALREEAPRGPLQPNPALSNAQGNLGDMLGPYLSEYL